MATTTNYGWPTPDNTDLVKDGAEAIRDLGSSIDSTTEDLNPATTEGDLQYRGATVDVNERLAIGTAGQVLQVNSGATAPEWAAPAGGGDNWTLLNSGNTTFVANTSIKTFSSISGVEKLLLIITDLQINGGILQIRLNGDSNANYDQAGSFNLSSNSYSSNMLRATQLTGNTQWSIYEGAAGSDGAASILITGGTKTGFKAATMLGGGNGSTTQGQRHSNGIYRGNATISSVSVALSGVFVGPGTVSLYGA